MIFSSPHPTVAIPEISLTDFVLQRVAEFGDKPAIIEGPTGRTITYAQLAPLIRRLAAGLADLGLQKGDVLAIYSPNLPEFALTFHAVASLGGVVTMVPPLFTDDEIKTQLRDSAAKFLVTVPALIDKARDAASAANIEKIIVLGDSGSDDLIPFASLLDHNAEPPASLINPREDLVALPYSSGTTGFPKGVMLTHRNLVAMLCQLQANDALTEDDTMICVVPMYHLYGLHVVMNLALSQGATVVTLPRYDLKQFLEVLEKYEVTIAPLVPPLVLALSRAPEVANYDLSNLRLIHCGAASLSSNVAEDCVERLGCQIKYGYGLTEVSPLSHASLPLKGDKPGSVGYCLPNTECKIVDPETNAELPANAEGEIWIRGPQVMKGYLGNPQATEEMIDKEGWLRSGDVGYADEQGRLFVVDRLKELIKYKGRQVAPAELEAVLLSHPAVVDAGVIPSPDEEAGEVPKAFVVLKGKASAEELMDFVAQRVAPHKRIRLLEFVKEIPKSPAGKILRRLLVQRERTHTQSGA
ncbi:MAG TPA: 4-coumarate--CoA ligase family protein [Pyrinomonadaceae bacterium]|nr:4-coumarate--CoA ligase family protein [Pyrinomonadaceae bacterium]